MLQDNRTNSTPNKDPISWTTIILTTTIAQSIPTIILRITIIKAYCYFLPNPRRTWTHLFHDNLWIYLNYLTIYHNLLWILRIDTLLNNNNNHSSLTTNLSNTNDSLHLEDHNNILARIAWLQAVYILTTIIYLKLICHQDRARMNYCSYVHRNIRDNRISISRILIQILTILRMFLGISMTDMITLNISSNCNFKNNSTWTKITIMLLRCNSKNNPHQDRFLNLKATTTMQF